MPDYLLQGKLTSDVTYLTDYGSGAHENVTAVIPNVPDGWFYLGQTAQSGLPNNWGQHLLVRPHPDSYEEPLAEFVFAGWSYVWGVFRNNSNNYGLWRPKQVPDGYVVLSDMFWFNTPPLLKTAPKAVSAKCTIQAPIGACIWNDHGSGARDDGSMWAVDDARGLPWKYFRANNGYGKPGDTAPALNMALVEMIS